MQVHSMEVGTSCPTHFPRPAFCLPSSAHAATSCHFIGKRFVPEFRVEDQRHIIKVAESAVLAFGPTTILSYRWAGRSLPQIPLFLLCTAFGMKLSCAYTNTIQCRAEALHVGRAAQGDSPRPALHPAQHVGQWDRSGGAGFAGLGYQQDRLWGAGDQCHMGGGRRRPPRHFLAGH